MFFLIFSLDFRDFLKYFFYPHSYHRSCSYCFLIRRVNDSASPADLVNRQFICKCSHWVAFAIIFFFFWQTLRSLVDFFDSFLYFLTF